MTPAVDVHREIGKRIAMLRTYKGWSQQKLAAAAGLSARTISQLEAWRPSTTETLLRIAKALGCKPSELLDGGPLNLQ